MSRLLSEFSVRRRLSRTDTAAVNCDPVGSELHGLGSSINCLGRRVASYTTRGAKEITKPLAVVP